MKHYFSRLIPFVVPFMEDNSVYRWTQKTIYQEPPKNHALHLSKAEAKRKRKADKLRAESSR